MRTSLVVAALPLGISALPCGLSSWSSVSSALENGWRAVESTLMWSDVPAAVSDMITDAPEQSVYQWINGNKDFSKLAKLINYDEAVVKILDGASHGLTFFAPDNNAIPDRKHHDEDDDVSSLRVHNADALSIIHKHLDGVSSFKDDDKDKKRREIFKKILHQVLLYHVLPYDITGTNLGFNSSVPTALRPHEGAFHAQQQRIKVEHTVVPPSIKLNKYITVTKSDIKATNGIIHVVDHPVIPPASVFDTAFMLTQWLSTTTSALQRVGLEDAVHWHYKSGKPKGGFVGAPSVSFFAPSNEAWKKLPEKLIVYLFSPFGARALRKLLQYHVVPEFLIYAEWVHSVKDDVKGMDAEIDFEFPFPTALGGREKTLGVKIKKTTPTIPIPGVSYIEFKAQGEDLDEYDIPARNGVLHVLPTVLDPRKAKPDFKENNWEDWEEWLPQWADEE